MKLISEQIIRPMNEANTEKGRINRKLIQNIFFISQKKRLRKKRFLLLYGYMVALGGNLELVTVH